jgi:hypothetical protein
MRDKQVTQLCCEFIIKVKKTDKVYIDFYQIKDYQLNEDTLLFTVELEKKYPGQVTGFYPCFNQSKTFLALAVSYNQGREGLWNMNPYTNIVIVDMKNKLGYYDSNFLKGGHSFYKMFFYGEDNLICDSSRGIYTIKVEKSIENVQ